MADLIKRIVRAAAMQVKVLCTMHLAGVGYDRIAYTHNPIGEAPIVWHVHIQFVYVDFIAV